MSLYPLVVQMKKMLGNLDHCLDKAVEHAKAKKFDPENLLGTRLAPDMFPLVRQIQTACDQAKYFAARTAGKEPPSHPDVETTIAQLKERIAAVVAYLGTFTPADFDGVDGRRIGLPRWEGKSMSATEYALENSLPNFFFHVTTAYALLRHNGVDLGKKDYLGPLPLK